MSNHDYYERFKDNVVTVERLGGEVGIQAARILENLKDVQSATTADKVHATKTAREKYLAVLFLVRSDRNRYGALVRDIRNE
jgi:hypothetical protein